MALTLFSINYWLLSNELRGRERAEQASRALSTHLIKLQDEERRRFWNCMTAWDNISPA
jgi:hypothetical protein